MFKTIAVGIDGRNGGRDALALAERLAGSDSTLVLVNVWRGIDGVAAAALGALPPARDSEAILEEARRALDRPCRVISREAGSAGAGLHRTAEEEGADLLVIGSHGGRHGHTHLRDAMRAALHGAPCSVAVAPSGYADAAAPIARIGVAWRDDAEGGQALDAARALAAEHGAQLEAVHALEPVPTAWAIGPYATLEILEDVLGERAAGMRRRMSVLPGVATSHVVDGPAISELVRFSGDVDLLVLGSRGYGPLRRVLLGSTADGVATAARCPVLVLRRGVPADVPQAAGTGATAVA
jgi:nucleotide-binding universal stress UspA family protein